MNVLLAREDVLPMSTSSLEILKGSLVFDNKMTDEEFSIHIANRITIGMELGVRYGWWKDFDSIGPIRNDNYVCHESMVNHPLFEGFGFNTEEHITFFNDNDTTLAHILVKFKLFKSVSDGRKNGWNKPIPKGFSTHDPKQKGRRWGTIVILNRLEEEE